MLKCRLQMFVFAFFGLALVGCTSQSSPSAVGKAMLLDSEPADTQDVGDYKTSLVTGLGMGEATIVGRVRSGGKEPWDAMEATFLIASLATEDESHSHDGDDHDCPFCAAKELESMTLVRMVDETGAVIQEDPRKLLGLKENQIVAAVGEGMLDDDGGFLFDASKVFIRSDEVH